MSDLGRKILDAKRRRAVHHCMGAEQLAIDLTRHINWLVTRSPHTGLWG